MEPDESKPWYLSKGFIGPLVTALLMALRNLGVIELDTASTLGVVYQLIEFSGVVVGAYGRATATQKLKVS